MSSVFEKYIASVRAVNEAKTKAEHDRLETWHNGFHNGLLAAGVNANLVGIADTHYIEQGIDRPMCGGVFLDWEEPHPCPPSPPTRPGG